MNYYDLFNIPFSPVVDHTFVAKKYFELQKKYHPDFYTQATEAEKEEMLQRSADVNKAYNLFRKKEHTIEYYLQQKGVLATDEKYDLPPAFLMEMMELNEALTEEDEAAVTARIADYDAELDEAVAPVLAKELGADISDQELLKLKDWYFKKKYLKRILDRLSD